MRRYETIFIIDPDLLEEARLFLYERLKDLINRHKGMLVKLDDWGSRKLAYEVKKRDRGYYIRLDFCGTGILVDEIERLARINDGFLKYMTILLNNDVDLDVIKQEILDEEKKEESENLDETDTSLETETQDEQSPTLDSETPKSEPNEDEEE